ncbi:MAG: hypothetical protein HBSIN02_24880 [Bacteroidia bacterium]|nr:MAG: hypothetical protein HBSIN02_24880 [Bacteroidia bacterium]
MKLLALALMILSLQDASRAQLILSTIHAAVDGPAELIIIDSLGRRTGFDPIAGIRYSEIPSSGYGNEGADSEDPDVPPIVLSVATINNAFSGIFHLRVIGSASGSYRLMITLLRIAGNTNASAEFDFQGSTQNGEVHEFRIHYDRDTTKPLIAEPLSNVLSNSSLFATHSLWLEQNSTVYSGDIGVNEAGSPPFLNSDVELTIGIGATVSSSSVKAHRIKVKDGAMISAEVYYNELENKGTITGNLHAPLILPLVSALPEFKTATPGSTNITVPQDGQQILEAGSYGDILVRRNGTLTLSGGVYHFNSFNTGDNVRIVFQSPSEVRIAQKFDSDQGSYIGPEDTISMTADQIVFYIGGINGSNGGLSATPKAAQIGIANTVKANFYVPNGTLWIRQNSQVTGAFMGKDVDVGIGVKVWHKSAF